jgi:hypothetical protein
MPPAPDWTDAVCREVDPELFFPIGDTSYRQIEDAKKVCAGCPIRSKCLDWALETRQDSGVWGGLSERERREIARVPFSQVDVCWENQALIEEKVTAGVPYRQIAKLLGVGHHAVARAVVMFRKQAAEEVRAA